MKITSIVLFLVFVFAFPAAAQSAFERGFIPYWSYGSSDVDSVNLAAGTLMLHVPIVSYPQRGTLPAYSAFLTENSASWFIDTWCDEWGDCYSSWVPDSGTYDTLEGVTLTDTRAASVWSFGCFEVYLTDNSGASHQMAEVTGGGGAYVAIDGSAFRLSTSGGIIDPNGNMIEESSGGAADPFGNSITTGTSDLTDSIGRTLPYFAMSSYPTTSLYYPGPPSHTSVTYTFYAPSTTVDTHFGFSGVSEYSGGFQSPTTVTLPNSATWSFTYDGNGNVSKVTYPSGGYLSYTYVSTLTTAIPNGNGGYYAQVATRTVNDGTTSKTWTYTYSVVYVSGMATEYDTKVTDPDGNDTYHRFNENGYEFETDYYHGSGSGGSGWIKQVDTTYSTNTSLYYPVPIVVTTTLADGGSGQVSKVCTLYDNQTNTLCSTTDTWNTSGETYEGYGSTTWPLTYGRPVVQAEYDYGSGSPGSLLRKTVTAYEWQSNSSYLTPNLMNPPASVTIYNGSGTEVAETTYAYDESTYAPSGCSSSAPCGALTTVNNYTGSSSYLTSHHSYTSHGMPSADYDPTTTEAAAYTYDSTGLFLSEIAYPNSLTQLFDYDLNTGVMIWQKDANSQETSYTYDAMRRLLSVSYPTGGGSESYSYTDSSTPNPYFIYTKAITSSINFVEEGKEDGLGRPIQTITTVPTSTCSGGYSYVTTGYDGEGRQSSVTNPDCSSTNTVGTSTQQDPLNRVTTVTAQDGGTVTTSYSGRCATTTDEAGKVRKSCTDGLGRMTVVWENPSGLNYETDYGYDPNNNLLSVSENSSRSRTFYYDFLSRLTSAANPESGTTNYYYTTSGSGLCAGGTSAVCRKTDARSTTTTYTYDASNRLTQKSYSDSTPTVNYVYDGGSLPSGCSVGSFSYGSYPKAQRTAMCDAAGSEAWSYDTMGRPLNDQRTTNSVTETTTYTYNYDGSIATLAYPSGRTITYTPNVMALPVSAVDTANSINYATSGAYMPYGALASLANGSSLVSTMFYDTRLQPCRTSVKNTGTAPTSCTDSSHTGNVLDYNYSFDLSTVNTPCSTSSGSPTNNGNLASLTNNVTTTRSQNFCYDALNRIAKAQTTSTYSTSPTNCWGESYTIDAWGNLTGITPLTGSYSGCTQESGLSISVGTSNQISASGFGYDSAGNMTSGPTSGTTYAYNAENQITLFDGTSCSTATACYVYDGDGKRVEKSASGSAYKLYWYNTGGNVLDETDGSGSMSNSSFNEYVFFNGTRISRRDSSSNVYYYFADHLGSGRVITNSSGTMCDDVDYYPYGGERDSSNSCPQNYKFTGKERDSESNLDNFGARYYTSLQGRFMSPDWSANPDPVPYADFSDPQTLNLYSYVRNNPLSLVDPDGHTQVCSGDTDSVDENGNLVVNANCVDIPDLLTIATVPTQLTPFGQPQAGQQPPQAPAQQKPQKKPCTPLANNRQGTPAAGLDALFDGFSRLTHPLDMLVVNGTMFLAAGGQIAAGGIAIAGGCLEPTPFEPLTCIAGGAAGTVSIASGTASGAFGVYFFKNYTLPAIKDWGCHE